MWTSNPSIMREVNHRDGRFARSITLFSPYHHHPLSSCVSTSGEHQRVRDFTHLLRKLSTHGRESGAEDALGWRQHFR